MDIFLDDKTSLVVLRTVRRSADMCLVPSGITSPSPLPISPVKLSKLGISELLSYLRVPEKESLGIVVPNAGSRVRTAGIECHVAKRLRGSNPFCLLAQATGHEPARIMPSDANVYVQDSTNIVLGMAHRLNRRIHNGASNRQRELLMLVKLILELCGTFAHNPLDPHLGDVAYNLAPATSIEQLNAALLEEGYEYGLPLAREAASLAYNNSGSPQESFLGPALFFSSRLGGLDLGPFVANEELDLTDDLRRAIGFRRITPDFQMKQYRLAIESKGAVHDEGDNPRIDRVRSLDYQTVGERELAFVYEDVKTRQAFMKSATRILAIAEQFGDHTLRKHFLYLCSDPGFAKRQMVLFEVFRPWLRWA